MAALRIANLGVRFILELAALAAYGYWAAGLRAPGVIRVGLTICVPLGVALLWGLFIAPKARYPTGRHGQAGLGLLVFLVAALLLRERGLVALATPFAVTAVVSSLVLYALPQ